MKKGTVIVDISADIGGAIETYRLTTHEETSVIQNREWRTPEDVLGLVGAKMDIAPKATTTEAN